MRPVICMITDGCLAAAAGDWLARVAAAVRAGVHLVQIRERGIDDRVLSAAVAQCVDLVRGTPTRVIVNDRLDIALGFGAHGVHLRSDSFPARRARTIVPPGFLVGRSIHGGDDIAVASESVDYVIFGTVFATSTKPGRPPAGTAALAEAVRASSVPVLAVGGVSADNAGLVAQAGAAGIAAISLFSDSAPAAAQSVVERIVCAFDLPLGGS